MLGIKLKKYKPLPLHTIGDKVVGLGKPWNLANLPLINDNSCFSDFFGHMDHVGQGCHVKPDILPFAECLRAIQTWAAP